MKTSFVLAGIACLAWSGAALSADLPQRTVLVAPAPVAPAFTWTGFYIGANAGYAWSENRTRYGYTLADPADLAEFSAQGIVPPSLGSDGNGFIGGVQVGYNYQIGQFVLGLEADIQYMDADQRASHVFSFSDADSTGAVATTSRAGIDWLGTVRARAGFAFDRALIYATGGLAYGRTTDQTTIASVGIDEDGSFGGVWSGRKNDNRFGWTIGGGIEYALTQNITVKAEYLYYDLGSAKYAIAGASTAPDDEFLGGTARRKASGSIVRAGLNWKFSTY